jgi:hypothetical protein
MGPLLPYADRDVKQSECAFGTPYVVIGRHLREKTTYQERAPTPA